MAALDALARNGIHTVSPTDAVARIGGYALVVTSPGFPPTAPVLAAAAAAEVPIWGDVELAWRLDATGRYGPPRSGWWSPAPTARPRPPRCCTRCSSPTGRAVLCGNIGEPVLDVLSQPADLLAVELSSFQLHWAPSLRPEAGAVLNVAEDHLDWHGSFAAYAAAKARALGGRVAVAGVDDAPAAALPPRARRGEGGLPTGRAGPGELGVRDGRLVDRAFAADLDLCAAEAIPVAGPVGCSTRWAPPPWPGRWTFRPPRSRPRSPASGRPAPGRAGRGGGGVRYVDDSRPPTRTRRRPRCWPTRGWCGWPAACSRGVGGRHGHRRGRSAGRRGADRPGPRGGCQGVIATRTRCPGHRGCDAGGC